MRAKKGEARIFAHVAAQATTDACILWPFAQNGGGYGMLCVDKKRMGAYRYVCFLKHGECPSHLRDAAHTCGIRLCVNGKHIRWTTRADNRKDCIAHGTANRGHKHGKVKITEAQVYALRRAHDQRANVSALGRLFGLGHSAADQAARRITWKWLPEFHDL